MAAQTQLVAVPVIGKHCSSLSVPLGIQTDVVFCLIGQVEINAG